MTSVPEAFLRSWPFDPWLLAGLGLTAGVYLRGWLDLRLRNPKRWPLSRLIAFLGGLLAIFLALASPIEPFAALLLQVHMIQHLLLMMAAPPLLWLGTPLLPILRGLPPQIRIHWVAPLFRIPALRTWIVRLTHPVVTFSVFVAVTWIWHASASYELALRNSDWHYVQHVCFLGSGLLFWFPVIRPYPSHVRWSLWLMVPYLILADVQNTVLSALLTFSSKVLYPHYLNVPRLGGISAEQDQSVAGVLMWVPGSLAFLLPLFGIVIKLLCTPALNVKGRGAGTGIQLASRSQLIGDREATALRVRQITLPLISSSPNHDSRFRTRRFDLLRVPFVGQFLKWRHARLALQLPMAALAGILIIDGLRGPQISAMNLAGVLPWIHWRGILILGLLAVGNISCMACPFLLPRTLARRWLPAGRNWPPWLRSKWLAVVLLVLFLWSYEAFSLWDSPWWTAWIALGYFALSFVIDGFFRDASFCKYVCPIGQFNFVQSLVSPLEVTVSEPKVCESCTTHDCIRGRDGIPGCELHLYQPLKVGNMDCTFCMDCLHACPHQNIGLLTRPVGKDLWHEAPRSGVGIVGKRLDIAVLVVVLVFGAFANAAGMVAPVVAWRDQLDSLLGLHSPLLMTSLFYLVTLLLLPLLTVWSAAVVSCRWGRLNSRWLDVAMRFSYALVPIGFGMWLAHYSFHFMTSYDTVVPTAVRFMRDLGFDALGVPTWVGACCRPVVDALLRLEILFLDFGLLLSLFTGYRIALVQSPKWSESLRAFAPWAVLITLLFALGIWIIFQPMQMRGTLGA